MRLVLPQACWNMAPMCAHAAGYLLLRISCVPQGRSVLPPARP